MKNKGYYVNLVEEGEVGSKRESERERGKRHVKDRIDRQTRSLRRKWSPLENEIGLNWKFGEKQTRRR